MVRGFAWFMLFAVLSGMVCGGTLVDVRDRNGRDSQFLTDGKMARLNMAGGKTYLVLDYADQSMKAVTPETREVLDLSGEIPSFGLGGPIEKTAMTVEAEGDGPEVAGYATQQYKLSVHGEFCGTAFASKQAMKDAGLDQMFKALQKIAERTASSLAGAMSAMSPCQRGKTNMFDHVASIGAPLRSLDEKGQTDVEVTRIQTDISLPPDTFAIPNEYKVLSLADKMKQQLSIQLRKLQENMPESAERLKRLLQQSQAKQ
jgi:hypothetical protein